MGRVSEILGKGYMGTIIVLQIKRTWSFLILGIIFNVQ